MAAVKVEIELDPSVVAALDQTNRPIKEAANEMIVLELYRQHTISCGKAAQLLGMPLLDFMRYSSRLGIPYIDMTADEWEREMAVHEEWARGR